MERITGAHATVRMLERHGVDHVFGLCGHTVVAVLDALEGSPIRFVAVHHEQTAAHAADGLARRTGKPGVVMVHLGPGLTNAITGIANAMLDAVPMVVISGNVQSYFFGRHAHMETNLHRDASQADSLEPFCKRVWRVDHPAALVPALDDAFRYATTGRRGPVLVDVAMDVFSEPVDLADDVGYLALPEPPSLAPEVARRIVRLLRDAQRPVLHLGDAASAGAEGPARELAEGLGLPVAYELLGKGVVPDDHPLTVGMTGFWGTPAANLACQEADVLLSVGTKFGELDSSSWVPDVTFSIPPTRLVHIHPDPDEIGRSYPPTIGAVADPRRALEALVAQLGDRGSAGRPRLEPRLDQLRSEFHDRHEAARTSDQMPMRPERVLSDLRAVLPEDAILVGDTGWNKNGVGQQLPMSRPGAFVPPGGYATMGFGPAAALGVVLGTPAAPVVALVGDGAFLANLSVVLAAVEERLPVVWAVMNNSSYATITGLQRAQFGSDYGTLFDTSIIDLAGFARSVGARGARVEEAAKLRTHLDAAIGAREPYVLDIPTTADPVPTTGRWDINELFQRGKRPDSKATG